MDSTHSKLTQTSLPLPPRVLGLKAYFHTQVVTGYKISRFRHTKNQLEKKSIHGKKGRDLCNEN